MHQQTCDHLNPATFVHRDGRAYCRGCRRFLGRVVVRQKETTGGGVPTANRKDRTKQLSLEEARYGEAENE